MQAGGGLRWFETIEPHVDDPALHAVLLTTGGFVAIGAGEPDVTRRWEREALDIAHDDGRAPYAVALAGCIRAAPLILTEPEEAPRAPVGRGGGWAGLAYPRSGPDVDQHGWVLSANVRSPYRPLHRSRRLRRSRDSAVVDRSRVWGARIRRNSVTTTRQSLC